MNSYIAYELYRQRVAEYEREAEIRRNLPKREHRRMAQFRSLLPGHRRRVPLVARTATKARPCH